MNVPLENGGNKISSVKFLKEKVVIRLKDERKIELPKEVFSSFYIYKGKNITDKEIKDIYNQTRQFELYKYARKISSKRVYSEHKMREKLYLKTNNTIDVNEVINKLKKNGLINDSEFVKEYVEYANNKNIGKNKIRAKLQEKGVFSEEINKIHFDEKLEYKKAKTYLAKLDTKYDKYNYQAKKDKAISYLIAQGFDLNVASDIASELSAPKHKEEVKKLKPDFDKAIRQYKNKYSGREFKDKVFSNLLRKGYKMNDIINMWEEKFL
ncbi:MAG: RecX family transcriptional regulator [Bacilli bacterium]|nr:RecX family transcriptional regulator [Bacilli bacterium]